MPSTERHSCLFLFSVFPYFPPKYWLHFTIWIFFMITPSDIGLSTQCYNLREYGTENLSSETIPCAMKLWSYMTGGLSVQ